MDERAAIAAMYRRCGFGLAPGQLDALVPLGIEEVVRRFVDPDGAGVAPAPDPWSDLDLSGFDPTDPDADNRELVGQGIYAWLHAMATTTRPFEEWMRWFWHGHFVSAIRSVKVPQYMVQQMRILGAHGVGDFRSLLHAVTIDPAMLIYLDGATNVAGEINENYGREVLELFALGVGNYTEADVRAGATALTGWRVWRRNRDALQGVFDGTKHDDSPQRFLGRDGVNDVDAVIDTIVSHPACAPFITERLAVALLGPDVDAGRVSTWAKEFAASGLQIRPLVQSIVRAGVFEGAAQPMVLAPVPWFVSMVKATALANEDLFTIGRAGLPAAGQIPWGAPNVAGWPSGTAWFSSASTVARLNMATALAGATPTDAPLRAAARSRDWRQLADGLGHPEGFGPATLAALDGTTTQRGGGQSLAVAIGAPEVVIT